MARRPDRDEPNACSCVLPEGCWTIGGWHFRPFAEPDAVHMADVVLRKDVSRESNVWRDAFSFAMDHYGGTPIATEHCPAYIAKLVESRRKEKMTKIATSDGHRVYVQ